MLLIDEQILYYFKFYYGAPKESFNKQNKLIDRKRKLTICAINRLLQ